MWFSAKFNPYYILEGSLGKKNTKSYWILN